MTKDGEEALLTGLMERNYGEAGIKLYALVHGGKSVYRVGRADGPDWILRAYRLPDSGSAGEDPASALAAVLLFLERHQYSAERVIRTVDGSSVTAFDDWRLLVTTYLGQPLQIWQPAAGVSASGSSAFDCAPQTLRAFGEAIGRLHALRPDEATPLPFAGMLPGPELAYASKCLVSVAGRVPMELQAEYDFLIGEVQRLNHCSQLPHTVLHNDCNLGNAVMTPEGEVALVDWEGAGIGPAVIDVGFMLANCFDKQRKRLNREALVAIVEG